MGGGCENHTHVKPMTSKGAIYRSSGRELLLERGGELAEARRLYRKMVAYNLPGRNLAQSRAERLPVVEE